MNSIFSVKFISGIFLICVCLSPSLSFAGDIEAPVSNSADGQMLEFENATVLDKKTGLVWMRDDYWQMFKQWVNWYTAGEFVQRMNNRKFAGYTDWRLPTVEEAQTLYNRRKRNLDKDGDKIFIDPIFPQGPGWSTWTSAEKKDKAMVVSYKDEGGSSYQDKVDGTDAFIRLVRKATP
jgi:hypothetical protein